MTAIIHPSVNSANVDSLNPLHAGKRIHRSQVGDPLRGAADDPPEDSMNPVCAENRIHGSKKIYKVPAMTLRLPAHADIKALHAVWRDNEEYTSKRVEADRLLAAMDRGDLAWIEKRYPWFMKTVENLPARKNAPPFKDPQDPGSADPLKDSKEESLRVSRSQKSSKRSENATTGESEEGGAARAAMVAALAEVTGMDAELRPNARKLDREADALLNKSTPYTPDQVREWKTRCWNVEWPGKNGDWPELPDVVREIGHVRFLPPLTAPEAEAEKVQAEVIDVPPAQAEKGAGGEDVTGDTPPALDFVLVDDCEPSGGALATVDPFELGMLGYAVEAATGTSLEVDKAAAAEVRLWNQVGYTAENIAHFLQVIWPLDWRAQDVDFKGRPRTPERPTFELLRSGLAHTRHHLEMTKFTGPDALGQELQHRIESIRKRVAAGESVDLKSIQSAEWDQLTNRYLRNEYFRRDEEEETGPLELKARRRPRLEKCRAADAWTFMLDQLDFHNKKAADEASRYLALVEVVEGQEADAFVVEVYHKVMSDNVRNTRQSLEMWLTEQYCKPVHIQLDEIIARVHED